MFFNSMNKSTRHFGFEKVFFLCAFFFVSQFSFATEKAGRGAQTLIPPRHWIYDSLQILEQESGIVQFSDQAPLTIAQIRSMLLEIEYEDLSAAGKAHYDNILEFFGEKNFSAQASIMQARIEPAANLEGFFKTNDEVPWVYDRFEKKNFLELPITLGVGDYATFFVDVNVAMNKNAKGANDIYLNVPLGVDDFDVNFPHEAYGSLGVMFTESVGINFRVSNMPQNFGRAQTGSIMQSEFLTDATSASLSIFSPIVQYTAGLTQFNTNRYMYSHKADIRIGKKKKFQISLMEACLPYGPMDLRFFNPMMFFHGYASWLDYKAWGSDVGSFAALKMNFAPVKFLRLYALWSMTQLQLAVEMSEDDEDADNYVPNAMGWQAGVESYIPMGPGHLHLNLEGYYAQPYLYINSSPNWSFVRTSSESNGSDDFYEWMGTRYGPDTIAATFCASYEVPKKWSAGFKYLFLARGELSEPDIFKRINWGPRILDIKNDKDESWDWVYPVTPDGAINQGPYKHGRNLAAPSGKNPEFVNIISLNGTYCLKPWLDFFGQTALAIVANSGHEKGRTEISFECALGARFKFTKIESKRK